MAKEGSYKIGDRVVRSETTGPTGTVTKVRSDTGHASKRDREKDEKGTTIAVLWDNGTLSHFIPEGLSLQK